MAAARLPSTHNAAHVERQVLEQLWMPFFWEKVNDSVHGLVGAVGMEGR